MTHNSILSQTVHFSPFVVTIWIDGAAVLREKMLWGVPFIPVGVRSHRAPIGPNPEPEEDALFKPHPHRLRDTPLIELRLHHFLIICRFNLQNSSPVLFLTVIQCCLPAQGLITNMDES